MTVSMRTTVARTASRCAECGRKERSAEIRIYPGLCGWCRYNADLGRPVNSKGQAWRQILAEVRS